MHTLPIPEIIQACARITGNRWGAIASFLGPMLRDAHTFGNAFPAQRDPYMPGFGEKAGREVLCHAFAEIPLKSEEIVEAAESGIDGACYRLECQLREKLRGSLVSPPKCPAIEFHEGDRLQVVALTGSNAPIRYRIHQGDETIRIDIELMLARVEREVMAAGAAERMATVSLPVVSAAREVHPRLKVLLTGYSAADGTSVTVAVAVGDRAGAIIREAATEASQLGEEGYGETE